MIKVKDLTKEFTSEGKSFKAVDRVSFSVDRGEIYGIIGLSGAGKSTLVRCLNRLEEPTSGEIVIDGRNIMDLSKQELLEERKEIGMIFQSFNLFHQKTVGENIAYPLEISGVPKEERKRRVGELLKFIDLENKKNAYPAEISGGQKQRVAIARALATNPKILLSDEGTSALDPANTKQILDLLRRAVKEFHMTVVMITHQMEVAREICDRIGVMDRGKIIEENTVEKLFTSPKTSLSRSFIRSLKGGEEEETIYPEDHSGKVVRLGYPPTMVKEPLLSRCIRETGVDVNLLTGNINRLQSGEYGYMVVELLGDKEQVYRAMAFLDSTGIEMEVL